MKDRIGDVGCLRQTKCSNKTPLKSKPIKPKTAAKLVLLLFNKLILNPNNCNRYLGLDKFKLVYSSTSELPLNRFVFQ